MCNLLTTGELIDQRERERERERKTKYACVRGGMRAKFQICKKSEHLGQRAKKVVSDSPGLVDFAIGLVNSVLNLPDGQEKIFLRSKITEVL